MSDYKELLEKEIELRTRHRDRIWRLSRDLFAVLDVQGLINAANPSWWRVLGLREEQLLGTPMRELIHEHDVAKFDGMFQALHQLQPVEHVETRLRRRDGACCWISWTAVPQLGEIYAVGRDVTEFKQAAVDLQEATATLKSEMAERQRMEATLQRLQRSEAVGQIAAGVAHDFNNLLAVVLGHTVLLEHILAARDSAQEGAHLTRIRHAVEGGRRVVRQLLTFSRPQPLKPQSLDLNAAVTEIRELLKSSLGGAIQFTTQLHEALWLTWADRTQLEMALLNLVINARDAMPGGGEITVRTGNVQLDHAGTPSGLPHGEYVSVSISDTGTGMSPEVRSRAFEPFFTTKEPGQGSGLGLAQVADFSGRFGGCVLIDTRPGTGTTVCIYLPRARVQADPETSAGPTDDTAAGALRRGSVLVVEDDAATRAVTASILKEAGHAVYEAEGGGAALEILKERPIDVLVVDYAMPVMNGAETARLAQTLNPDLAVLFLTGYADVAGLQDIGGHPVMEKPCDDEELRRQVASALRNPKRHSP